MDMLSMLMNARIKDMDGDEIGEVLGVHIVMGKLYITVDMELDDGEEDDPDGGEEVDEDDTDDEHELDNTEEVPKPIPLRAVAGGKQ